MGWKEIERAAVGVDSGTVTTDEYHAAQQAIWQGIRADGNPWRITDFVSFGSPMSFADRLLTRNPAQFRERVERREIPTCPPRSETSDPHPDPGRRRISYNNGGRKVLYHGAPFAVVRWTNLWFPPRLWFFGDWFGGPLAPLFGKGIKDIPIHGNRPWSLVPAGAHALYVSFPKDTRPESITTHLRAALDLASSSWLAPTVDAPDPEPTSRSVYVPPKAS